MKKITLLIFIFLCISSVAHSEEYLFGEGLQVEDSPLIVGGYLSTVLESGQNKKEVHIDDVALLMYGEYDQIDFMAEFETADMYAKEFGSDPKEEFKAEFHTERLYLDYYFDDTKRLRVGKFNSDAGFWNQMPINVLRDTTSSPHLVNDFFPKLTTGLNYEFHPSESYFERLSLTFQNTNDLDSEYNNFNIDRHYSVSADIKDQNRMWRLSGGYFRYKSLREALYLLAGLKMEDKGWNLLIESIVRKDHQERKIAYDIYAQGVWHIMSKHDLIVRGEVEKAPVALKHEGNVIAGYTYRPLKNVALKGEYEAHQNSDLNRLLCSVSVLF